MPPQQVYRAFEGGGVRGIAHIGAAAVIDTLGSRYQTVANVGTSAGSDAAALLSSGLTPAQAKVATNDFPFAKVVGELGHFPPIALVEEGINLGDRAGMHDGARLEKAITDTLTHAGAAVNYAQLDAMIRAGKPGAAKLFIVAHDISNGEVVFPGAYSQVYGITDPTNQSIPFAARASSSIPGFFTPAPIRDARGNLFFLVDGGCDEILPYATAVQLAKEQDPGARVINFALGEPGAPPMVDPNSRTFTWDFFFRLLSSLSSGRRDELMRDPAVRRDTVMIDTSGVSSTEFDLSRNQQSYLYNQGVVAGLEFAVRDLGQTMTADERRSLNVLATQARADLAVINRDAVRGKDKVTTSMLQPLIDRLDTVSRQVGGAPVMTLG